MCISAHQLIKIWWILEEEEEEKKQFVSYFEIYWFQLSMV